MILARPVYPHQERTGTLGSKSEREKKGIAPEFVKELAALVVGYDQLV